MHKVALVVGVSRYDTLAALLSSANDAEAIARLLQDQGDFTVRRLPEVKNTGPDREMYPNKVGQTTKVTLQDLKHAKRLRQ
jgi:hypothetical protein